MFPVRMGLAGDIQHNTLVLHCLILLFELLSDAAWACFWNVQWDKGKAWIDTADVIKGDSQVFTMLFWSWLYKSSNVHGGSEVVEGVLCWFFDTAPASRRPTQNHELGDWQSDRDTWIVKCVCLLNLLVQRGVPSPVWSLQGHVAAKGKAAPWVAVSD